MKGAVHCDDCGCTWLDDGLNPVGCPYCKVLPARPRLTLFTYEKQPGNVDAWKLGEACREAQPGGDLIDYGLSLLQKLQKKGFGVIRL